MVGVGTAPVWLERALYAADAAAQRKKILVAIFQRGAADGLNIVVPHAEKRYYELRPTIAIPAPGKAAGANGAIDLDGRFALHPSLQQLKPLWDSGQLASLPLERLTQPGATECDDQLVTRQLDDTDTVRIGAATIGAPQAKQDRRSLVGQSHCAAARQSLAPPPALLRRRENGRRARTVGVVADRCQQREFGTIGAAQPEDPMIHPG